MKKDQPLSIKNLFIKSKSKTAVAFIVTAVMIMITVFSAQGQEMSGFSISAGLILSAAAGIFLLWKGTYGRLLSIAAAVFFPAFSFILLEYYSHILSDLTWKIILLNLLFFYLLYAVMTFLFGSIRIGFGLATAIPMIFGLVNYFVVSFRGHPIVPWDFLSLGTAVSVADNYEFSITWKQGSVLLLFIWLILLSSKSRVKISKKPVRIGCAALSLLLLSGYLTGIQKSSVQSYFGMDTTLFTLNVLYRNNGIAAAFLGNLRFLDLGEPEDYSPEKAEEIISQNLESMTVSNSNSVSDRTDTASAVEEPDYPNIIVIMNEAFSDLSVWGEFATSQEVMPFFQEMQEKGIGGELYVSVKGGNTANTEFEFLTGDTMAFLPTGSIPYQQYLNEQTPSLASYLKTLGYSTLAIHPYYASGWDRDEVYDYFSFDEFLDIKSFDNPVRMRGYVSDQSAFEKIIEQYQLKADGERMFIFEVTMQNHGGYSKETPDFDAYLTLPEIENKSTSILATEKYLTLIHESDLALKNLISYFEEETEPVVILMFGDHQPSDYITNVIRRICGVEEPQTTEEIQQGYRVPFMIWSNRELEPAYYDGISVNYLSGILMEAANIPLTGYQSYLQQLMQTLPVINGNVIRDSNGIFTNTEDETYAEQLKEYKILQYYHLFDAENRTETIFK